MSRTLFWYIFWDLFKIFMLTSGVLSAIMSFGGLLRPLYEYGLDVGQVGKILSWSSPAMTAYSLPIAALFAATIVYGRFGADNEITACRSAGISFLSMALPAFALGLLTAFASVLLLCFVVPASMLQVERIVYSNLAKLVSNQIERTHQIKFDQDNKPVTVFAQASRVLDPQSKNPRNQEVELIGPVIATYLAPDKNKIQVPEEFYMATRATIFINQEHEDEDVQMWANLENGTKFPRSYVGSDKQAMQISIGTQQFGPIPLPSPIKENTKFMDISQLRTLLDSPEQSRRIRSTLGDFISRDQEQQFLQQVADQINGPENSIQLSSVGGETYTLMRGGALAEVKKDKLFVEGDVNAAPARLIQLRG